MTASPIAAYITDTHLSEATIDVNVSIFTQVFDICKDLGIGIVVHGGDVFTSRKGQSEIVLNTWKRILDLAASYEIKIIVIAGNHDKTSYVEESSFLDAFDKHPGCSVITPFGSMAMDGIMFHFVPYYDEKLKYMEYLDRVKVSIHNSRQNILFTHVGVNGVRNNDGSEVQVEIPQSAFDRFDLVLIGHYHNRQLLSDKVVYPGSAYPANFGEDRDKGCVILYDDCSYEYIMLDFPQYTTVECLMEDVDRSFVDTIMNGKDPDVNVRLKLAGEIKEEQKPLIVELQKLGIKLELIKEDFKPADVVHSEAIQMTSSDIMEVYGQWVKENNIKDSEFGKELLQSTK